MLAPHLQQARSTSQRMAQVRAFSRITYCCCAAAPVGHGQQLPRKADWQPPDSRALPCWVRGSSARASRSKAESANHASRGGYLAAHGPSSHDTSSAAAWVRFEVTRGDQKCVDGIEAGANGAT